MFPGESKKYKSMSKIWSLADKVLGMYVTMIFTLFRKGRPDSLHYDRLTNISRVDYYV